MASPWTPPQRPPAERPWMGMALLAAIPALSLILIRMLWSGSSLWFLAAGIILLGAAAVFFLARRPQELEYDRQTLPQETSRVPLILTALGVFFLALLLLPNFSGGDSSSESTAQQESLDSLPGGMSTTSGVPESNQPPVVQESESPPQQDALEDGQVYVVESGDTLWDIAQRFGTTVDAIAEANDLANPGDLQVGQELQIPEPAAEEAQAETTQ